MITILIAQHHVIIAVTIIDNTDHYTYDCNEIVLIVTSPDNACLLS